MLDVSRGAERVRRWPKKRPGPGSPKQRQEREKFRQCQKAKQYVAPAVARYLEKTVEGSPLLPRDALTMMLYNRWFMLDLDDGRKLWPMPAIFDVSEALDVLGQPQEGDILVRGPKYWEVKSQSGGGGGLGQRFTMPNLRFQDGVAGDWTLTGFTLDTSHSGLEPWASSHAAYCKTGGGGQTVSREIDLTTQFTASQLDAGGALTLSFIWGNWGVDEDWCKARCQPRDASGNDIGSPWVTNGARRVNIAEGWQPDTSTMPMPNGVRKLFVEFESVLADGSVSNVAVQGIDGFLTIPD